MASLPGLEDAMERINLDDSTEEEEEEEPEYTLFNPQGDFSWLHERLNTNIPRFLFRVATPRSDGSTDETWVRSASATTKTPSENQDIFSGSSEPSWENRTARMLNQHLRWQRQKDEPDKFVSWTSSLVFAIHYIFYRHFNRRDDGSSLEDIKVYVVDTTLFPRGTFVRDLDLIEAFRDFDDYSPTDANLKDLWDLRVNKGYYFGEYLIQNSLKIGAGKCQVISGQMIFGDDGDRLYTLQRCFGRTCQRPRDGQEPRWANAVLDFRNEVARTHSTASSTITPRISLTEMHEKMRVVQEIMDLFDAGWKFPMAVYFAALMGKTPEIEGYERQDDHLFFEFFRSEELSDERSLYTPSEVIPDGMPELDRVREIFRELDKDAKLRKSLEDVHKAELALRSLNSRAISQNGQCLSLTFDSNPTLAELEGK